jgi:hypothetical protein
MPRLLWPLVFLITNFVHDKDSVTLMMKIVMKNGEPELRDIPFDMSELSPKPSIFDPERSDCAQQIVHVFLKPQMMLHDAFFSHFKSKHTNAPEVVVRHRFCEAQSWVLVNHVFCRLSPNPA